MSAPVRMLYIAGWLLALVVWPFAIIMIAWWHLDRELTVARALALQGRGYDAYAMDPATARAILRAEGSA
jgi:hypothetical protein